MYRTAQGREPPRAAWQLSGQGGLLGLRHALVDDMAGVIFEERHHRNI